MANPTSGWDRIPVFGWYFAAGEVPVAGLIRQEIAERVNLVDGTGIYPKGMVVSTAIGDPDAQDPAIRSLIRQAYRDLHSDANTMPNGPGPFNGTAFDAWWDARLPAAVFTSFYASDDPNIVQTGYQVKISERLIAANGQEFYIEPRLSDLDTAIPGINLGLVDVPPGSPTAPAPIYQKGQPGGVAALDLDGDVVDANGDKVVGGGGGGLDEAALAAYLAANPQTPADGSVANAEVASGAGITLDKTADSSAGGGRHALTTAQQSKLNALPSDAQSAAQVDTRSDARIAAWVGAADGALNTLAELGDALGDDANFAATMTTALAGKVSKTGAETITGTKTFSSAPVVPDDSFALAKIIGLITLLTKIPAWRVKSGAVDLGAGPGWPLRPTGFATVVAVGADPSPTDSAANDIRFIPAP